MSTVLKALHLLDFFDEQTSSFSLNELVTLSGYTKSKVRRYLLDLLEGNMIEYCSSTNTYRIGLMPLRLAKVREACTPMQAAIDNEVRNLSHKLNESVHCCIEIGGHILRISVVQSKKKNRIVLPLGEKVPWHASASGLAILAFSSEEKVLRILNKSLPSFTEYTVTDINTLKEKLTVIQQRGYSVSENMLENGISSVAVPFFNPQQQACGALSVVMPSIRFGPFYSQLPIDLILRSAKKATSLTLGQFPKCFPGHNKQVLYAN